MKAFGYEQNGGPEVFQEYELPTPEIKSNQILIKTEAFNLNNFEAMQRAGKMKPTDHRIIPGRDVAGFVERVGEDVTDFDIGWWHMAIIRTPSIQSVRTQIPC